MQDDLEDPNLDGEAAAEEQYSFEDIVRGSIASKINVMDFLNPLNIEDEEDYDQQE